MKYILLAGIHGVGKSTLAFLLESELNLKSFSISNLIRKAGKRIDKSEKKTDNILNNQELWKQELKKLKISKELLLLDGHFCLLDKNQNIIALPFSTFQDTEMTKIILMQKDPQIIRKNLLKRDNTEYSVEFLTKFQEFEKHQALKYSKKNNIPLFIYDENTDLSELIQFIID